MTVVSDRKWAMDAGRVLNRGHHEDAQMHKTNFVCGIFNMISLYFWEEISPKF
jgi:hypothetical protein